MNRSVRPYGSWGSEIDASQIASAGLRLSQPRLDRGHLYWLEGRPAEQGRQVVMRAELGAAEHGSVIVEEVSPPATNVRTTVHEYGGGDYTVGGGRLFFVDFVDQRIHVTAGQHSAPLSRPGAKYADLTLTPDRRWLLAVEERPRDGGEPENRLVAFRVPADGLTASPVEPIAVASGHDFYSFPTIAADGGRIAYTAWDHPNMPWDGTRLYLQSWGVDGPSGDPREVAGGDRESIFQPSFSPGGALTFVSDRTGWWNLYQLGDSGPRSLCPRAAEFGYPQWVFGLSRYGFVSEHEILCVYSENGRDRMGRLSIDSGALEELHLPYSHFGAVAVQDGWAALIGGGPDRPPCVAARSLRDGSLEELRRGSSLELEPQLLSRPEKIEFDSKAGRRAHAWYYAPCNPRFEAAAGQSPPLLVKSHGGPTAAASAALDLRIQYWVSRGFAVVDVDYGGSSGYGREYRELLTGQWGVVDVEDCVAAATYLAEQGRVDRSRLAISGGSAGGYTTLCALTFHDVFHAGASHYGIGDLESLARDTHKFESRYTDGLVGPYPEQRALYRERSPIHFTERLNCPVIFFQGLEDRIVPPDQAEAMVAALARRGIRHAYVPFEGEQHGFRRAANICTALEGELYFYSEIFGFDVDVRPAAVRIVG